MPKARAPPKRTRKRKRRSSGCSGVCVSKSHVRNSNVINYHLTRRRRNKDHAKMGTGNTCFFTERLSECQRLIRAPKSIRVDVLWPRTTIMANMANGRGRTYNPPKGCNHTAIFRDDTVRPSAVTYNYVIPYFSVSSEFPISIRTSLI